MRKIFVFPQATLQEHVGGVTASPAALRREALARAAPFAAFMLVLALRGFLDARGGNASGALGAGFDLRWLYAVQALLAALALLAWRRSYRELAALPRGFLPWFGACAAGAAVFVLWISPMPPWMHVGMPTAAFVPVAPDGSLRWDLIAPRVLGAVVVVPVMEELFWRSFLMRWIERRDFLSQLPARTTWYAVLVSSAAFASAHELWFAGFVAGISYAMLYRRFGNLWVAVTAHAVTNGLLAAWVLGRNAWSYW